MARVASVMLLGLLTAGCASWWGGADAKKEEEGKKKEPPPLHLGAVHQVYPAQKFALLRIIGPLPQPGATLISHPVDGSTDRIGNLEVSTTSAPRNGMIVADIRAGQVAAGDRVFLYRNVLPPKPTEALPESLTPLPQAPSRVSEPRVDTTGTSPQSQPNSPSDLLPEGERGVEVTAPPASQPVTPADSGPVSLPPTPSAPTSIPGYLKEIPNDIDDWD